MVLTMTLALLLGLGSAFVAALAHGSHESAWRLDERPAGFHRVA
ncbi:hypothetical protein [Nocardioides montaniterrae]